jgi:hypothetical protein
METLSHSHSVISFDVGLRNLAIAHVRPSGTPVPADLLAFAHPAETLDDFRARGFAWFVRHGWALQRWEVVDVSAALERDGPVKNVKRLSDATKAMAIVACLRNIEASWFPADNGAGAGAGLAGAGEGAATAATGGVGDNATAAFGGVGDNATAAFGGPTVIAVEAQHNANAIMRGVAMGLMVHLHRSYPAATLALMSGGQKLKVCSALGIDLGHGTQAIASARSQKAAKAEEKAAAKAAAQAAKCAAKEAKAAAKAAAKAGKTGAGKAMQAFLSGGVAAPVALAPAAAVVAPAAVVAVAGPVPVPALGPSAAPARLTGFRRNLPHKGKARDKYEDNKQRAVLAVRVLFPDGHPVLAAHRDKQDDLCDALLMGIMALWDVSVWKAPRRVGRKRAVHNAAEEDAVEEAVVPVKKAARKRKAAVTAAAYPCH